MRDDFVVGPGRVFRVGDKLFGRCWDCHNIVRLDKPLFGSLHFCPPREEEENDG